MYIDHRVHSVRSISKQEVFLFLCKKFLHVALLIFSSRIFPSFSFLFLHNSTRFVARIKLLRLRYFNELHTTQLFFNLPFNAQTEIIVRRHIQINKLIRSKIFTETSFKHSLPILPRFYHSICRLVNR